MSESARKRVADFGKNKKVKTFMSGAKSILKDLGKAAHKNLSWIIATAAWAPIVAITKEPATAFVPALMATCAASFITYDLIGIRRTRAKIQEAAKKAFPEAFNIKAGNSR